MTAKTSPRRCWPSWPSSTQTVRLFTGTLDTLSDETVKGPAPGGVTQPAPGAVEDGEEQESQQTAADPNTMGELPQEKQPAIVERG